MANVKDRTFEDLRYTLSEYVRIFRRRWKLALLGLCLVGSAAFWISQYLPRQYQATTIFERRDDVVLQNLIRGNSPYGFDHLKSTLALDMTGSRALADAAVAVGLLPAGAITSRGALSNDELRLLDTTLAEYDLAANVKLTHSSPSLDTIELRCTANDATIASRFVKALRDRYIEMTERRIAEVLEKSHRFFQNEVARFQREANTSAQLLQQRFADFPGVDPSDTASVGARLEALRSEQARAYQNKADLEAQIAAREHFLANAPANVVAPVSTTNVQAPAAVSTPETSEQQRALESAIARVEGELLEATTVKQMTEQHPTVLALRRKLAELRAALRPTLAPAINQPAVATGGGAATEAQAQVDPVWRGHRMRVELELEALRAQLKVAAANLEDIDARVAEFSALYGKLLESNEEMQTLQTRLTESQNSAAIWQSHLSQLERIMAAEHEQHGTQFALIEEPKDNFRAARPQAPALLILCSACGLAAAFLLIALAELLDRSFRSAGQVTRLIGLPVLECIGVISTPRERRKQMLARAVWTPALAVLVLMLISSATLAYTSLEHPALHQRAIRVLDGALASIGAPPTALANKTHD
ncbi:MAG: hypothetical protein D6744_09965 [Planctomycetota bacterium]|nr:MAG: hypothetical protein D6744_09965 [Planctomycetota bacterium]